MNKIPRNNLCAAHSTILYIVKPSFPKWPLFARERCSSHLAFCCAPFWLIQHETSRRYGNWHGGNMAHVVVGLLQVLLRRKREAPSQFLLPDGDVWSSSQRITICIWRTSNHFSFMFILCFALCSFIVVTLPKRPRNSSAYDAYEVFVCVFVCVII